MCRVEVITKYIKYKLGLSWVKLNPAGAKLCLINLVLQSGFHLKICLDLAPSASTEAVSSSLQYPVIASQFKVDVAKIILSELS